MIEWTRLGTHLGRTINATTVASLGGNCIDAFNATVLLLFSRDYVVSEIGQHLLQLTIASRPAAIAVAGLGADAAFDDLLKTTSGFADSPHIMTAHLDDDSLQDLAESFLFGVIPAEERFDEWKELLVVVVEDFSNYYQPIVAAISKWVDK